MLKNYLKITLVQFKKHKSYSIINILGLAIGIACCILIISYIFHELSFDKFHDKANRIFRIGVDLKMSDNHLNLPKSSPPMADYFTQNFPEVLNAGRIQSMGRQPVNYQDKLFYEDRIFYADNSIFDIFTFPLIKGDSKTALISANSVVITEEVAERYFGEEEPVGRILNFNNNLELTVTAVAKNVPQNSHFSFDMLCSFERYAKNNLSAMQNWLSINNYTYILLQEDYDFRFLEEKFPAIVEKQVGSLLKYVKGELTLFLQSLTSIHLHSNLKQEISGNSSIAYIYIFAVIAILILATACFNFTNLATARSANRAKEVGIRKVLGGNRRQIITQFLFESIFFSLVSLILALLIVELSLPIFYSISGIELNINYIENPWLFPGLIGLAVIVGLFAGSYPAFYLSAFQPLKIVRGVTHSRPTKFRFRSILVIFQFSLSIVLIFGTMIVFNQLDYMKERNLGFYKNQLVVIPISDRSTAKSLQPFKDEIESYSGILGVAATSHVPGQTTYINPFIPEGYSIEQMQYMGELYIDYDFIPTMGIEISEGRNFSKEFPTDISNAVIINEAAAKKFGWEQPIGKTIQDISSSQKISGFSVIGVVKDFHIESLHKQIVPLFIGNTTHNLNSLVVRIRPENIPETISFLKKKMEEVYPQRPFEYSFLNDSFDSQYRAEERLGDIFSYFSVLAIFIACLGLFGLASYTAEQRKHEIGIRKVLGASLSGILILVSKEFTKWVLAANVIAWPIAYVSLSLWLQGFSYRTNITPKIFVFSALISLVIAFLTVSLQTFRAAVANPAKALRYE
ncbi:ABC transporter permease [Acidobacteriota bacterium]